MPKGEYDTPGPFEWGADAWIQRVDGLCPLVVFKPSEELDDAEVDELVDLLNRGTHCDVLMRVVYELLRYPDDKPPFSAAHTAFEAVMGREWDDDKDHEE